MEKIRMPFIFHSQSLAISTYDEETIAYNVARI
jgi:hypothetical protein